MSELRQKQKAKQIREKKVLQRDEVYHGALEDILLGQCDMQRDEVYHGALEGILLGQCDIQRD